MMVDWIRAAAVALACFAFAPAHAESCAWLGGKDTLARAGATGNAQLQLPIGDARAIAMDAMDCGVWALGKSELRHVDATGAVASVLNLARLDQRLAQATLVAVDPDDGHVWLAGDRALARLSPQGQLLTMITYSEPIRAIAAVGAGGVWLLGSKQLSRYSREGAMQESVTLRNDAPGEPRLLEVDRNAGVAWVATTKFLLRVNLRSPGDNAFVVRSSDALVGIALDPITGVVLAADATTVSTYEASGAPRGSIELAPLGLQRAQSIAVDATARALWVWTRDGAARLSLDGALQALLPGAAGSGLIAVQPLRVVPRLELVQPPDGGLTNRVRPEISLRFDADCNGQPCAFGTAYFTALRVDLTLNGQQIGDLLVRGADGRTATYVPPSDLPQGANLLRATVTDAAARQSSPWQGSFTVDSIPPVVAITAPQDGSATNVAAQVVRGTVSEPASVIVGEAIQWVPSAGGFTQAVTLREGPNALVVTAIDRAGNSAQQRVAVTLDTQAPASPLRTALTITQAGNRVTITGAAGGVEPGARVTAVAARSGTTATAVAAANGSFAVQLTAAAGETISLTASDAVGNTSAETSVQVPQGVGLPPDPATVATPNSQAVPTNLARSVAFLYSGSDPIQAGVAAGTIDEARAAVVRGRVITRAGDPLPGVKITVLGHPEYGRTLSRADGLFDLVVNGGGQTTIVYEREGLLTVQRQVQVPWADFVQVDDAALIPLDPKVTRIALGAVEPQVAIGSPVTDAHGTRQVRVLFPAGTTAQLVLPDGTTRAADQLSVRSTEFTVGPNGLKAMPGPLPPRVAYTHAVELSSDEAIAAGATEVRFNQRVWVYVDNFLGFKEGTAVPVGYYDRVKGTWIGSPDGVVAKVLSIDNGMAQLAVTWAGAAATDTELANLRFTEAERRQIATLFAPGQSFWRVPLTHFTPVDTNWSDTWGPDITDDPSPQGEGQNGENVAVDATDEENPCEVCGSIVEVENQVLGERIGVNGTPYTLNYRSSRIPGFRPKARIRIPLTRERFLVPNVVAVHLQVEVAGRRFDYDYEASPNLTHVFQWDGKDAYGRPMIGAQPVVVRIGYEYRTNYLVTERRLNAINDDVSWGKYGISASGVVGRNTLTAWRTFHVLAESPATGLTQGLGGWTLSPQHVNDPRSGKLLRGDGSVSAMRAIAVNGVTGAISDQPAFVATDPAGRIWGAGFAQSGFGVVRQERDGSTTTIGNAYDIREVIARGDDVYINFSGFQNRQIAKLLPNGSLQIVGGVPFHNGREPSEGPALLVDIQAVGMAVDRAGNIYYSEQVAFSGGIFIQRCQIRKISPEGLVSIVAGTGTCFRNPADGNGDGGPARNAEFYRPSRLAVDSQDNLYVVDGWIIRKITPDGKIARVAGRPSNDGFVGNSGDGGPARDAHLIAERSFSYDKLQSDQIHGLVVDADDRLLVASRNRIRRIAADGIIETVVGNSDPSCSEKPQGSAAQAWCLRWILGFTLDPQGRILFKERIGPNYFNAAIRRADPTPQMRVAQEAVVPAPEGDVLYVFDQEGRHVRTQHALTRAVLQQFRYDAAGRLAEVSDGDGNTTRIERNAAGQPTAIVAPFGQRTTLALDSNGFLQRIANPAGEAYQMTYSAEGLLQSFTNPRGKTSEMRYDEAGRLVRDSNAAGGFWALDRTLGAGNQYEVTLTSAMGRQSRYGRAVGTNDTRVRSRTDTDGTRTDLLDEATGARKLTRPEGTVVSTLDAADPRFGMLVPQLQSAVTRLPSGLVSSVVRQRTSTTTDGQLLDLLTQTDTVALNGKTATMVFDAAQRQYTFRSPLNRTSIVRIDGQGRALLRQAPGVEAVLSAYDELGRLRSTTQGTGAQARGATFAYDPQGLLATVTDVTGRSVGFGYDAAGRVTRQDLPGGRTVRYTYDANGNLASIAPPGRPMHTFAYTAVDRRELYAPPALADVPAPATRYTYNLDRQLTSLVRPDGQAISWGYDSAGRLATTTAPTGTTTREYDAPTGRLRTITAPSGVALGYTFDGPLLSSETWSGPIAGSVQRTYDADLRLKSLAVGGVSRAYSYDNDGLLTAAGALSVTRDPATGFVTATELGRVSTQRSYTTFGELRELKAFLDGALLFSQAYVYDRLGRIVQRDEFLQGQTDTYGYVYDGPGRLQKVLKNGVVIANYEYDANGNRLSDGVDQAVYDSQDRLVRYGSTTYEYTANGELSARKVGTVETRYDYDVLGNLRQVRLPDGGVIDYVIDGRDRRVGRRSGGSLKGWLYKDQLKPLAEVDASGAVTAVFVYGNDPNVPEYMEKGGKTYRLITDHLGSVRMVVDSATGELVQQATYDAFGFVLQQSNGEFQPFGFAGGLSDPATGLVRFGARDYDPRVGRWTAKDPILFAGGDANLFGYVQGQPLSSGDPSGLDPWWQDRYWNPSFLPPEPGLEGVHPEKWLLPGGAAFKILRTLLLACRPDSKDAPREVADNFPETQFSETQPTPLDDPTKYSEFELRAKGYKPYSEVPRGGLLEEGPADARRPTGWFKDGGYTTHGGPR